MKRPKLTKELVAELKSKGHSEADIAREFECSRSWVWRVQNRYYLNPEGKGLEYYCNSCKRNFVSYARTHKPDRCKLCKSWEWSTP